MQQSPILGDHKPRPEPVVAQDEAAAADQTPAIQTEIGGREGPEPTRYGDWEKNGRCIDF